MKTTKSENRSSKSPAVNTVFSGSKNSKPIAPDHLKEQQPDPGRYMKSDQYRSEIPVSEKTSENSDQNRSRKDGDKSKNENLHYTAPIDHDNWRRGDDQVDFDEP